MYSMSPSLRRCYTHPSYSRDTNKTGSSSRKNAHTTRSYTLSPSTQPTARWSWPSPPPTPPPLPCLPHSPFLSRSTLPSPLHLLPHSSRPLRRRLRFQGQKYERRLASPPRLAWSIMVWCVVSRFSTPSQTHHSFTHSIRFYLSGLAFPIAVTLPYSNGC